jgi:hypothetical protein
MTTSCVTFYPDYPIHVLIVNTTKHDAGNQQVITDPMLHQR